MTTSPHTVSTVNGKDLVIKKLTKSFRTNGSVRCVLRDISMEIPAGQFVVLLGPSGCGKSTLLRIVSGLDQPDADSASSVMLDGSPISEPGPDRGIVFQSYSSFPWLTAKQNVMFGIKASLPDRKKREDVALEYLSLVQLSEYVDFYPRQLSGGQQQRLAIARTLATKPSILLMDEPFAALDAITRERLQSELMNIWGATRPTVIFVTHDISEAAFLGQRIVIFGDSPAGIVGDLITEQFLEHLIRVRIQTATSSEEKKLASTLEEAAASGQSGIHHRGEWIREQPEFFQLLSRLKQLLPKTSADMANE